MLYTNSPAMHSSLIREFSSNTSSALPDAVVVRFFLIFTISMNKDYNNNLNTKRRSKGDIKM